MGKQGKLKEPGYNGEKNTVSKCHKRRLYEPLLGKDIKCNTPSGEQN